MDNFNAWSTGVNMIYLTIKEYKLTPSLQRMVLSNWYVNQPTYFLVLHHVLTWFLQTNLTWWLTVVLTPLFTLIVNIRLFTVRLTCKLSIHLLIKDMFEIMVKLIRMPYYLHCKILTGIVCLLIRLFINKWICLMISY